MEAIILLCKKEDIPDGITYERIRLSKPYSNSDTWLIHPDVPSLYGVIADWIAGEYSVRPDFVTLEDGREGVLLLAYDEPDRE